MKGGGILFTGATLIINLGIIAFMCLFLLIGAILTTILASELSKSPNNEQSTQHKWATGLTVVIWILWAILLLFLFVGWFLIPWLFTLPYLAGGIFILGGTTVLIFAIIQFYISVTVRSSKNYKNDVKKIKKAYSMSVGSGIFTLIVALMLMAYGIFIIIKFRKLGGIKGAVSDAVDIGGQAAKFAEENPELLAMLA